MVRAERPGAASRTRTVTVTTRGVASARFVFAAGKLNVLVRPWADVFVDGVAAGQTPLASYSLLEGRHQLRLVNPGGKKTLPVEIAPGKTTVVTEQLP